jgi:hypothetical protein
MLMIVTHFNLDYKLLMSFYNTSDTKALHDRAIYQNDIYTYMYTHVRNFFGVYVI